jgi:adenylate kinase family enzyme
MNKINVIATSGSGKTTFVKELATILDFPYIEMDALSWKDNWQVSSDEEFFEKLESALQQNKWVLDGNYHSQTQHIKSKYVDTIIWLDYPFPLVLWRVVKRSIARLIDQEPMWGTNNRESFRQSFMSRKSIILWSITSYPRMKKRYSKLFETNPKNLNLIRLKSPKEAKAFLKNLKS